MGSSPKKRSSLIAPSQREHLMRLGITVGICFSIYLITKPSSGDTASRSSSGSSFFGTIGMNRTATIMNRNKNDLGFWNQRDAGEFSPEIVWLMSYPNSGTSFTMTMVERSSNLSTATNYGDEVTAPDDYSLSIYPQHPEGPFWEGLSGKLGAIRVLPDKYVLVKTHCGSRCVKCGPTEYIETYDSFVDACRLSTGRTAPDRHREEYFYPIDRVKKAIHLIRSPYHNIVARYHLERKNYIAKGNKKWVDAHPSDASGFQQWCKEMDEMFRKEEFETFEHDMLEKLWKPPCHAEVFKFVQWHNLVFKINESRGIDTLVVYYEDYETNFNETVKRIFDFLEQPQVSPPRPFEPGHSYAKYYTFLDKRRVRLLVEEIASEKTLAHLQRYFDRNESFHQTDLSADKAYKRMTSGRRRLGGTSE